MKDYKKILEGVVNIINTAEKSDIGFVNICTYIGENCPELAESEDDKIRKEILAFIKREGQHIDKYKWPKWTAWLEKQGQKETTYDEDMLGAIEYCKKNNRPLEKEHIAWLEKQCIKTMDCSQNHQDSNHPNGCIVLEDFNGGEGFYKVHLDYLSKKQIEEVEEMVRVWNHEESNTSNGNSNIQQKTFVPKVEPKFHEGEWVIDKQGIVHQIANVVENVTNHTYGYDIVGGGYFNDNTEGVRLWTIQDAQEGDVLCNYHETFDNPLIFILRKFEHVNFGLVRPSDYSSYCFLTAGDRQRFKEGTYHHEFNIKPATKEQRDTLMKAMADAGYIFDFEKKELKKMEDEPNKCEGCNNAKGCVACVDGSEWAHIEEQNPAWSEEDEYNLAFIQETLLGLDGDDSYREKCCKMAEWLESSAAKHNQWKPSKEQMERLKGIINSLPHQEVLYSLYQDLKKLK